MSLPILAAALAAGCAAAPLEAPASDSTAWLPLARSRPASPPASRPRPAQEPRPPATLEALIDHALAENRALLALRRSLDAERERAPQAEALPDPRLSYRTYLEQVQTRVGPQQQAVGLSQTLPWFGKRGLAGDVADQRAETLEHRLRDAEHGVVLEVRGLWYETYYLARAIEVVRRNSELVAGLEDVVRTRYTTGGAEYADLLRAQVEMGKLDDQLRSLEDRRRPLQRRLVAAASLPADTPLPVVLELSELPQWNDADEQRLLQHSPELAALASEIEAARLSAELVDRADRPDVTLGLEWIDTGEALAAGVPGSGRDPWIASVSLNLPVWTGRLRAGEREARQRQRAAELRREERADRLRAEVAEAMFLARDARRRLELFRDTLVPRARQALEAEEAAYRGGRSSFLDLVDAERSLLEFELTVERARTDGALALARLDRLAGREFATQERDGGDR